MPARLRLPAKIFAALSLAALAPVAVSQWAYAGDGHAIAAGIAGGVAGTIASESLTGAPGPGYAQGYAPPVPHCRVELRTERGPYSYHMGQVRVCD